MPTKQPSNLQKKAALRADRLISTMGGPSLGGTVPASDTLGGVANNILEEAVTGGDSGERYRENMLGSRWRTPFNTDQPAADRLAKAHQMAQQVREQNRQAVQGWLFQEFPHLKESFGDR